RSELSHYACLYFVGIGKEQFWIRRKIDVRKADDESIVSPQSFNIDAGLLANSRCRGHRPWRVDAAAPRRQHADTPVAKLVANALDHDRRRIGHGTGCGSLVAEVLKKGFRCLPIEVVLARQTI